jgi:hypothetical protein
MTAQSEARSGPGASRACARSSSERRQLLNLAYRLLGSLAEAEDDHLVTRATLLGPLMRLADMPPGERA